MRRRANGPVLTWVFVAVVFMAATNVILAQVDSGTLSGAVRDPADTPVGGARVTLTAASRGFTRSVVTSDDGSFTMSGVRVGQYSLVAEKDGFAPASIDRIDLNASDRLSVVIRLSLAGVTETVSVAAALPASGTVGTLVDRRLLEQIPLAGRSLQSLLLLTPGVVPTSSAQGLGQFSVNGQRESSNYFTIDGVSANLGFSLGTAQRGMGGTYGAFNALGSSGSMASVDAIEEIKIQTSTFAPEFGRTTGGQVAIVTRGGTNTYRGTAFEYVRDDALDANDWFANSRGLAQPKLSQHQFGGVLGGPILRNRTFFFASYEGLRLRLPQTAIREVPGQQLREESPAGVREIMRAFPAPNGPEFPNGLGEHASSFSDPSGAHTTSLRVDQTHGSAGRSFVRGSYAPSESAVRGRFGRPTSTISRSRYEMATVTGGVTAILGGSLLNELRINWSRNAGSDRVSHDNFGGAVVPAPASFVDTFARLEDTEYFALIGNARLGLGRTAAHQLAQYNATNTLTWTRGEHEQKVGIDYRRMLSTFDYAPYFVYVTFASEAQALAGIASATVGQLQGPLYPAYHNLSLFAQDTWRASPRLTLTYGLRWEWNPPPVEKNGRDVRAVSGLDDISTVQLREPGAPLWKARYTDFAPRLGAAYVLVDTPGRETVLRGGAGVYHDLTSGQVGSAYDTFNFPFGVSKGLSNVPYPFTTEQLTPPDFRTTPPYAGVFAFDPNLALPRTAQWNLTIERAIGDRQRLTLGYVGAAGRDQYRTEVFLPRSGLNPQFANLRVIRNEGWSNYHALQTQFQRRFAGGVHALASYTLSKSTDNASDEGNTVPQEQDGYAPEEDEGASTFDRRHVGSMALLWDVPSPSGGLARALLGGWGLDLVAKAFSAAPINVGFIDRSLSGFAFIRPNLVSGQAFYLNDDSAPGGRRLNPAAFALPTPGTRGDLPRNAVRGFALSQVDLALRRELRVGPTRLQLRLEAYNVFNTPNFSDPETRVTAGNFGYAISMRNRGLGGLNALYQMGGPRSLQLGAKVLF